MTEKFFVHVLANGGLGCNKLSHIIEYDDEADFKTFLDNVMSRTLMSGYTSILHYNKYLSYAVAAYYGGSEPLAKEIMKKVIEYDHCSRCLDAIHDVEKAENDDKREFYVRYDKERYLVTLEQSRLGKWFADGCADKEYYEKEKLSLYQWFDGMRTALEILGFDPEEKETTHRICENLGLYRVERNQY